MNLIRYFPFKLSGYFRQLPRIFVQANQNPTAILIDSLVKRRLSDPDLEWERLKASARIFRSLEFFERTFESRVQKIAFGRSLELQEALKDTHFVINHGQSNAGLPIHVVAKKTRELFEGKKYQHFEVLRHPVFLEHLQERSDNVHWFKKKMYDDRDDNYRNELICGDVFLENSDRLESSVDFFVREKSMSFSHNPDLVRAIIEGILKKYPSIQKRARTVSDTISQETLPGSSLYSICIPKEKFSSMGYLSRAWGAPVTQAYNLLDLELCQEGFVPSHLKSFGQSPQVRLLTGRLAPENGVFILHHTTLDAKRLRSLEKKVESALLSACD